MKIDKRYFHFLFIAIMVVMMVSCVSLFTSLINVGLASNFFEIWARAFVMAFSIALPVAFVVARFAEKIVARITA
jgi:Protein of unknown function (DUF2798)